MATCSGFDDATRCFEVVQVEKVDAWTERIDETQVVSQAFHTSFKFRPRMFSWNQMNSCHITDFQF